MKRSYVSHGLLLVVVAALAVLGAVEWGAEVKAAEGLALPELPGTSAVTGELVPSGTQPSGVVAPPLPRQRYGFVATSSNWRQKFDVEQLGAGWYVDASPPACGISPGGMDRAIIIRVAEWQSNPAWTWLESMVDAHPGSMWLVGNEPDCVHQDNMLPDDYAEVYHDIYTAIKGWDDTALISPGGIVQATPLRLQWLDLVLQEYARKYGGALMPVDVWNIHNQILQEVEDSWGADIPPGVDPAGGVVRNMCDNYRLDIFEDQIWAFREWMAQNDYSDRPLIVTEFGVLIPEEWCGKDIEDVKDFMDATFEFFETTTSTDPDTLGYPTDGFRLVQRWAWFSLDNPPYDPSIPMSFPGNLFDPYTTYITAYGLHFATHTDPLPSLGYVDLRPGGIRFEPVEPVEPGELVTRGVEVEVLNLGNLGSGPFVVRLVYQGPKSGELEETIDVPPGDSTWVTFNLVQLEVGAYEITVLVDADEEILEAAECENLLEARMVVPTDVVYMPLITRRYR